MRRRLWIFAIAVPLLAVVADALLWHFAASRLQAGLDDWVAAQRAAGWTVDMGDRATGGWPFSATLTVRDLVLQGGEPEVPGGLAWRPAQVVLRVPILHPATLEIGAAGAGHLRVADSPDIAYTADHLRAAIPLRSGPVPNTLDVHADDLRLALPAGALSIDRLTAHIGLKPEALQGQPAVSLALEMAKIELPAAVPWALGPRIASLSLDAALNGPLSANGGLTACATAWRDDGGSLEIERFDTVWGPLGLNATATLALDPQLQPMGAGTAHVQGYAETADALVAHGLMSRSAAIAAKALLSLLARTPDDGGPAEVDVPLSLQYRTLSMRQVPLVRFPELDWPGQ